MAVARGERRFRVKFPVIQLRPEYGGKRALVMLSAKPRGDQTDVVLCTVMDIDGKMIPNIPVSLNAIRAAALKAPTFVEVDDDGFAPSGGLYGANGQPL